MDSGTTSHFCKSRKWFKKLDTLDDDLVVYLGVDSTQLIEGVGIIDLVFTYGKVVTLFDVLYVPTLRRNIVTTGCLNYFGNKQTFESNTYFF